MNKDFLLCLCLLVVSGLGWAGSKGYEKYQAGKVAVGQQTAAAKAAQKPKAVAAPQENKSQASDAQNQQKMREQAAVRAEIQEQLKAMKVSSILLGSPNLAVINKKSYEEGSDLRLPNGKSLKVKAIKDEGVMLAYGEQTFQIGLPTARDIGEIAQ